jgi:DNA-binding NarL/FixJ family response regulator
MIRAFIADDSSAIRAAVRRLRESEPDISVCVVIAVTFTQPDEDLRQAVEQLGAFRVLDKTTLFDSLVPAIREAVRGGASGT